MTRILECPWCANAPNMNNHIQLLFAYKIAIMVFIKDDWILIRELRTGRGYGAKKLLKDLSMKVIGL